jgi:putative ABC transport system permease protein
MFGRRRPDDFAAEIEAHLAHEAERLRGEGLSEDDARAAARRQFGNVLRVEERFYESARWLAWDHFWQDVRFGARLLVRRPGFAAVAIVTLGLGIAVNATIFSLVSAFILRRPPVPDIDRIVVASGVSPTAGFLADTMPVSPAAYLDWKDHVAAFGRSAAANEDRSVSFGVGSTTELLHIATVTPNYFDLLGATAKIGRTLGPGDEQPGQDHVVVLSEGLWRREFAADPAALGRTVRINRETYTVVGVMPGDFRLLGFTPTAWTPLVFHEADRTTATRAERSLVMFARLAPGATLMQAQAQVAALAAQAAQAYPALEKGWGGAVRTLPDYLVYNFAILNALVVLMTTVGFVLLIACANVAGLLIARAAARGREIAIRRSLGAGRLRIVRQLATEGLVLTLAGGALGLQLTWLGVRYFQSAMTFNDAVSAVDIHLDWNVLFFTMAISVVSALLVGIVPGLGASRVDINAALKREGRSASSSRSQTRLRTVLVTGEIALAMFLLLGTGLLLRSLLLVAHQDLGFRHASLLTARLRLDEARYADNTSQVTFARSVVDRLSSLPGVDRVAITSDLPATGSGDVMVRIRDVDPASAPARSVNDVVVSPGFFETAGIPLLRGRTFTDADSATSAGVVIVNQAFVQEYLSDRNPLTTAVALRAHDGPPVWMPVVGVVANVKSFSEDAREFPELFEVFTQRPLRNFSVLMRTSVDPAGLASSLRSAIAGLDVDLPLSRVLTMDAVIAEQAKGDGIMIRLLALFAGLAFILAVIGLYGLIAYSVGQRTHEIAIRLAMGARRRDVLGSLLRHGVLMAAVGCVIGLAMALPLPRVFDAMFNGLHVNDPRIFIVVPLALFAVTLVATFVPARRALGVDPIAILRHE